jgi:hypothetical protein
VVSEVEPSEDLGVVGDEDGHTPHTQKEGASGVKRGHQGSSAVFRLKKRFSKGNLGG